MDWICFPLSRCKAKHWGTKDCNREICLHSTSNLLVTQRYSYGSTMDPQFLKFYTKHYLWPFGFTQSEQRIEPTHPCKARYHQCKANLNVVFFLPQTFIWPTKGCDKKALWLCRWFMCSVLQLLTHSKLCRLKIEKPPAQSSDQKFTNRFTSSKGWTIKSSGQNI